MLIICCCVNLFPVLYLKAYLRCTEPFGKKVDQCGMSSLFLGNNKHHILVCAGSNSPTSSSQCLHQWLHCTRNGIPCVVPPDLCSLFGSHFSFFHTWAHSNCIIFPRSFKIFKVMCLCAICMHMRYYFIGFLNLKVIFGFFT